MITESSPSGGEEQNPAYRPTRPPSHAELARWPDDPMAREVYPGCQHPGFEKWLAASQPTRTVMSMKVNVIRRGVATATVFLVSTGLVLSPAHADDDLPLAPATVIDLKDTRATLPQATITWSGDGNFPRVGETLTITQEWPSTEGFLEDVSLGLGSGLSHSVQACVTARESTPLLLTDLAGVRSDSWEEGSPLIERFKRPTWNASESRVIRRDLVITEDMVGKIPCAHASFRWRPASSSRDTYLQIDSSAYAPVIETRGPSVLPYRPRTPYMQSGQEVVSGLPVTYVGRLTGGTMSDGSRSTEEVLERSLRFSIESRNTGAPCKLAAQGGVVRPGGGTGGIFGIMAIPANSAGKFLCVQQTLRTSIDPDITSRSEVVYVRISASPSDRLQPLASLSDALGALAAATTRLDSLRLAPQLDQEAVAAAIEETEAARQEAEAAAAQAAQQNAGQQTPGTPNQATPTPPATPAEIDAAQEVIEAAGRQVEEALDARQVGQGANAVALRGLVTATGFDPLATPILAAGEKNASGVGINVKTRKVIRQKKRLRATLRVEDPVTRGGMRMYLVSWANGEPEVKLIRRGFVPRGAKNKRFWISKRFTPGTYGLLTTFQPSTPGIGGVATYDEIQVRKARAKRR